MAVSAPPGGAPADTGADVAHLPMEPGPMNTYLLLLHENPRQTAALTPEQNAALVERYRQWASALGAKGQLIDGQKLADEDGRVMRPGANGPATSSDSHLDAVEVIGGYFVLRAPTMADAEALAATCPHLHGDNRIVIRRIERT